MSYDRELICKCGGELLSGTVLLKCGDCGRSWFEVQEWMKPKSYTREFSPEQQKIIDAADQEEAV